MQGPLIKKLRRRIGLTQGQLAERIGVDQGTVSRWEREIEAPRPRYVARLRHLLISDDESRVMRRSLALIRNDLVACTLMDRRWRLTETSDLAVQHYLTRYKIDIRKHLGTSLERYADRVGLPGWWDCMERSGLLTGDALLVRMAMNICGQGHETIYEPLVDQGEVVAVLSTRVREVSLPMNGEITLERFDVLRADAGDEMTSLHMGPRAGLFDPN